jgi:hypothetical protein
MDFENEIRSVLDNVEKAFSKLDIEAWLNCFHPKRIIVLPNIVLAPKSAEECTVLLGSYIDNLKSKGYNKSNLEKLNIRPLTDTTAIASTIWSRFNNNSLIERVGATYLLIKSNGNWEITMVTAHPDDA